MNFYLHLIKSQYQPDILKIYESYSILTLKSELKKS
jgi:hypothetical protein